MPTAISCNGSVYGDPRGALSQTSAAQRGVGVQRQRHALHEDGRVDDVLEHALAKQRDARRAMQQMTIDARTMELARQSEEKLERARTRQSAFMESRVASCQALNSSASAPQLAEPVRTASY